jgi:hypothetical protein
MQKWQFAGRREIRGYPPVIHVHFKTDSRLSIAVRGDFHVLRESREGFPIRIIRLIQGQQQWPIVHEDSGKRKRESAHFRAIVDVHIRRVLNVLRAKSQRAFLQEEVVVHGGERLQRNDDDG